MQKSRRQGFTLLELLIAIAIVSMVMTTAFAALRIGSRSWEAGQARSDSIEEMRSLAEFLRRQIGQSVATSWEDEAGKRIVFSGRRQQMRFVAPAPLDAATVGLLTYSLKIGGQPGRSTLRLGYAAFDPGATAFTAADAADAIAFTTTFDSVSLHYFGHVTDKSRDSWYSEWPETAELLPTRIRIRFAAQNDSGTWPDLVIPLYARLTP